MHPAGGATFVPGPPAVAWWRGALVWLGIAGLFTLSIAIDQSVSGVPQSLVRTAWSAGGIWLVFGAFAPGALRLFRTLSGPSESWGRLVPAFLLSWAIFHVAVQVTFVLIEQWVIAPLFADPPAPLLDRMLGYGARRGAISVLTFLGVVGFDQMRRTLTKRAETVRRAAELQAELATARLDMLRSQLQPHFLFNALNAVAAEVPSRPARAQRMIAQLGELLHATLAVGELRSIPLEREFALVRAYLEIQQVRFSDRLRFELSLPPDLAHIPVPALILQPLVENAVRHGIEKRVTGGTVRVSASCVRHAVELRIEDDGVGLPDGECRTDGVGLTNTRERLAAIGDKEARLELGTRAGGGAIAIVRLGVSHPC